MKSLTLSQFRRALKGIGAGRPLATRTAARGLVLRTVGALACSALGAVACSSDATDPAARSSAALDPGPSQLAFDFDTTDVLTQRNDNARTGASIHTGLNASTFQPGNHWGLIGEIPVQGDVYAQPLYVTDFAMNDGRRHDVLIVATYNSVVHAFDASTFQPLWTTTLDGQGVLKSTPVIDRPRGRIYLSFQAPTSDPARNPGLLEQRIVSLNLWDGKYTHNARDAAIIHVVSSANIDGAGNCDRGAELCGSRDAFAQNASLLLSNDILYVGFGGAKEGQNPYFKMDARYRGQLLAFNVGTMDFAGGFQTVQRGPHGSRVGGGVWQGLVGPAADANGDVYIATGNVMSNATCGGAGAHLCVSSADCNGAPCLASSVVTNDDLSPEAGSYGNSIIHLRPRVTSAQGTPKRLSLDPVAWFTPYRSYWHNKDDFDLGSAGPVLLPGTNQLLHGGKESILYLLDRDGMRSTALPLTQSEYDGWPGPTGETACQDIAVHGFHPNEATRDGPGVQQELGVGTNFDIPAPAMDCWPDWPHVHGSPIYAELADGSAYMYVWPEKDYLKAYRREAVSPVRFSQDPVGRSASVAPVPWGMPGGMLALSTDPNGGGVLFATVPMAGPTDASGKVFGSLRAYDPVPDGSGHLQELWNDNSTLLYDNPAKNKFYAFAKFDPPTIGANQRVYVPTFSNRVIVYGTQSGDVNLGSAHVSVPSGHVTAIQQNVASKVITAALVGSDGAVHIFWEMNNGPWLPQQSATVTPTGIAPPGAPITLAAEVDGRTFDTFFVDDWGAVNWLSVVDGQNWVNHGRISDTDFAPVGAQVTTAIQGAGSMDAFVVGNDGAVYVFWKPASATFFSHGALPGTIGQFNNGEFETLFFPGSPPHRYCGSGSLGCAHFATGSHASGQLSLVGVNANGQLDEFVLVRDGVSWTTAQPIPGAPAFSGSAHVAGGNHANAGGVSFDVAIVGEDGALNVFSNEGSGWRRDGRVSPSGFAPAGAEIATGKFTTAGHGTVLYVVLVGNDGAVDAFEYDAVSGTWSSHLYAHTPSFGTADPGAPVAVALQSAIPREEVIDYLVSGKAGVFVSFKVPTQQHWSRPEWIFH